MRLGLAAYKTHGMPKKGVGIHMEAIGNLVEFFAWNDFVIM